jgi:hypothetical protein
VSQEKNNNGCPCLASEFIAKGFLLSILLMHSSLNIQDWRPFNGVMTGIPILYIPSGLVLSDVKDGWHSLMVNGDGSTRPNGLFHLLSRVCHVKVKDYLVIFINLSACSVNCTNTVFCRGRVNVKVKWR